jgi:hypothetical protein
MLVSFVRDPDRYYFRTLPLPPAVFSPHQSGEPKRIIASAGVEGKVMKGMIYAIIVVCFQVCYWFYVNVYQTIGFTQPTAFSDYDTMIVRIYAPRLVFFNPFYHFVCNVIITHSYLATTHCV